jgi:hypothetical protein
MENYLAKEDAVAEAIADTVELWARQKGVK